MAVPIEMDVEEVEEEEEGFEEAEEIALRFPQDLVKLLIAAEAGNVDLLRQALDELNGSVNDGGEDGDTALHLACLYGHLNCVQVLLAAGAAVDVRDEDGAIPLHDACAGGFLDIVKLLLQASGSSEKIRSMLNTIDVDGDTPLHHSARGNHQHVVEELLSHGASPDAQNLQGKTPGELADEGSSVQQILASAARQHRI